MLCSSGLARFFFSLSLNFYFALAFDFPPAGGEIFCNSFWTSSGDILPWASAEAPPDDSVFEPQPDIAENWQKTNRLTETSTL